MKNCSRDANKLENANNGERAKQTNTRTLAYHVFAYSVGRCHPPFEPKDPVCLLIVVDGSGGMRNITEYHDSHHTQHNVMSKHTAVVRFEPVVCLRPRSIVEWYALGL